MNDSEMIRILVVDDDLQIRRVLQQALAARGYEVILAECGEEALKLAELKVPQLIVLDLSMPGIGGIETCRLLRRWIQAPIIILTVRDSEEDKVAALDSGADDYLTKPFGTAELLARVRAHLRRARLAPAASPVFESRGLRVDFAQYLVTLNGQEVKLTKTEFEILRFLIQNAGRVLTHSLILRRVWEHENASDSQTLRVHIGNLRKKIEPDANRPRFILTEPGVGYRFEDGSSD